MYQSHCLWRKMPELSILSTFISLFPQYILSGRLLQNRHCKFCGCQNKILRSTVHSEDERAQRMESPCCVFNRHLRNKSSSILKRDNTAHTLWIYGFVWTVKFTDHEYLNFSAHLKALDGPNATKAVSCQGRHRLSEGTKEWWNERKPFSRKQLWTKQTIDGQTSSCTEFINISSTGFFSQYRWDLGIKSDIGISLRGNYISLQLKLQIKQRAAATEATSTIFQ